MGSGLGWVILPEIITGAEVQGPYRQCVVEGADTVLGKVGQGQTRGPRLPT